MAVDNTVPVADYPIDIGALMAYESGDLDDRGTLELFAGLVVSGQAWTLQGAYGRQAQALIDGGYLASDGKILAYPGTLGTNPSGADSQ